MKTKDNRIELLRCFFAVLIMIFHGHTVNGGLGHPIPLGHVFVEFFFFLTGYFTYAHIHSKMNSDDKISGDTQYPFKYTWGKIKKCIPYMAITAIVYGIATIFSEIFIEHLPIGDVIRNFSELPFDLLLLQITGISNNSQFGAWWYLSALVFALPVVMIIFIRSRNQGGIYLWIMWMLPMIIYGYFSMTFNGLDWTTLIGFTRSGFFRGIAGLCVGGIIFCLSHRCLEIKCSAICKLILTGLEIGCYSLAVLTAWKYYEIVNSTFIIVFLLVMGLVITFSRQSYSVLLDKPLLGKLGQISMPLYICHYSVGRVMNIYIKYFTDRVIWRYILYYVLSITMAVSMIWINKVIRRRKNYESAR